MSLDEHTDEHTVQHTVQDVLNGRLFKTLGRLVEEMFQLDTTATRFCEPSLEVPYHLLDAQ